MPHGWKTNIYRTDLEEEKFAGFFYDEATAKAWIAKQKEGTYEVSTQKPHERGGSNA